MINNSNEQLNAEDMIAKMRARFEASGLTTSADTFVDPITKQIDETLSLLNAKLSSEADATKRADIREQIKKQSLAKLVAYGKGSMYDRPWYKAYESRLQAVISHVNRMMHQRNDKLFIKLTADKEAEVILEDFNTEADKTIEYDEQWLRSYKQAMSEVTYTDPQVEILKRQDWTSKLDSLDDQGMKNLVGELEDIEPNIWQLNELLQRVKGSQLEITVMSYRDNHHVGTEYEASPEWKSIQTEIRDLNTAKYKPFMMFKSATPDPETGELYHIVDPYQQISIALTSYTISDPSQRTEVI